MTPGMTTPGRVGGAGAPTPGQTPLRDKLKINAATGDNYSDVDYMEYRQVEQKELLKQGLAGLPAPRNDYEIVLPDDELKDVEEQAGDTEAGFVEDQADIDAKRLALIKAERAYEVVLVNRCTP